MTEPNTELPEEPIAIGGLRRIGEMVVKAGEEAEAHGKAHSMAPHSRWDSKRVGRDEWGVYALLGCVGVVVTLLALWWTVKRGEA